MPDSTWGTGGESSHSSCCRLKQGETTPKRSLGVAAVPAVPLTCTTHRAGPAQQCQPGLIPHSKAHQQGAGTGHLQLLAPRCPGTTHSTALSPASLSWLRCQPVGSAHMARGASPRDARVLPRFGRTECFLGCWMEVLPSSGKAGNGKGNGKENSAEGSSTDPALRSREHNKAPRQHRIPAQM